eukprot:4196393-Alexandrium_andersonii.AAC.1
MSAGRPTRTTKCKATSGHYTQHHYTRAIVMPRTCTHTCTGNTDNSVDMENGADNEHAAVTGHA